MFAPDAAALLPLPARGRWRPVEHWHRGVGQNRL